MRDTDEVAVEAMLTLTTLIIMGGRGDWTICRVAGLWTVSWVPSSSDATVLSAMDDRLPEAIRTVALAYARTIIL